MSFREKSAWLMAGILLLTSINYIQMVWSESRALGGIAPPVLSAQITYIVILVVVTIIGHVIIALIDGREANAPMDERDKLIFAQAGHMSGWMLSFGVIVAMVFYWALKSPEMMYHSIFTSLLLSQVAEYGSQILCFRRGV